MYKNQKGTTYSNTELDTVGIKTCKPIESNLRATLIIITFLAYLADILYA